MINEQLTHSLCQLPGPKGLPLVGNLFQIDLAKLHLILEEWSAVYGDVFRFKLANKTVVAISDSGLIQNILRDRPQTYRRIRAIERVGAELGVNGVFAAEGELWQRQRQMTMLAFKPEQLRRFFPTMHSIIERLNNRWRKKSETKCAIDIQNEWMRFTVDMTTHFAFGYDINLLEQDNDDFQRHLEKFLPVFNRRANAPFPYWRFIKPSCERDMEQSLAIIKKTINRFVIEARQKLEQASENRVEPANFLEALILARDEKGNAISDAEILGNVITVLIAGEDTTAHTLAWMVYLMTEHPDVQRKIQKEADTVLGKASIPADLTIIEKLTYIEAVAHETMRLKSVTPILFIEPTRDVDLAGFTIPQGTCMMLASRYSSLQEGNFSQAHEFKPERWLEATPSGCTHNRIASIPFGAGPRFCPGRSLALLEIKMAIAMLCKNFTVMRVETMRPVQEIFSFTMMPDKLKVELRAR